MLRSVLSSIALAGLVTAGSVPAVARQQPTVTCTILSTGTLSMNSLPGAPSTIPARGLPLEIVSNGAAVSTLAYHGYSQLFSFLNCTSEWMGMNPFTTPNSKGYYG
jgi:hypothetical protein